jgi:rhodanese-related sulfurtransferase
MEDKLRFHTDSWDLSVDLKAALADIVVIDARSRDAYIAGHIPGAVSFPHRDMNAETVAPFDRSKVYVVYCDGIGCNASTKGAYKLARLDFAPRNCSADSIGGAATGIRSPPRMSPAVYLQPRNGSSAAVRRKSDRCREHSAVARLEDRTTQVSATGIIAKVRSRAYGKITKHVDGTGGCTAVPVFYVCYFCGGPPALPCC